MGNQKKVVSNYVTTLGAVCIMVSSPALGHIISSVIGIVRVDGVEVN